jgi:hypothetical protein
MTRRAGVVSFWSWCLKFISTAKSSSLTRRCLLRRISRSASLSSLIRHRPTHHLNPVANSSRNPAFSFTCPPISALTLATNSGESKNRSRTPQVTRSEASSRHERRPLDDQRNFTPPACHRSHQRPHQRIAPQGCVTVGDVDQVQQGQRRACRDGSSSRLSRTLARSGQTPADHSRPHEALSALPDDHRDPFDRLLIAQTLQDKRKLVSAGEGLPTTRGLSRKRSRESPAGVTTSTSRSARSIPSVNSSNSSLAPITGDCGGV